ncbi:hypothetical protein V6N13_068712 [Hibiscus sabdariffa]
MAFRTVTCSSTKLFPFPASLMKETNCLQYVVSSPILSLSWLWVHQIRPPHTSSASSLVAPPVKPPPLHGWDNLSGCHQNFKKLFQVFINVESSRPSDESSSFGHTKTAWHFIPQRLPEFTSHTSFFFLHVTMVFIEMLGGEDEETPSYVVADERIVELKGEVPKVLKALEAVVGHRRKFLVDQTVLPLFEETVSSVSIKLLLCILQLFHVKWCYQWLLHNAVVTQDLQVDTRAEKSSLFTVSQGGIGHLPVTAMRGSLFLEHERQFESRIPSSGISFYGQDPALPIVHSRSGLCRSAVPIVTQIAQTMQIPFSYAEDIIGIGGAHTHLITCSVGSTTDARIISNHKDPITRSSSYRYPRFRSRATRLHFRPNPPMAGDLLV